MMILIIVSVLLIVVSVYRKDEKLLIISSFMLFFTIFNILSKDVIVFKHIITIDRRDVFHSLIIKLYIQFIVVFFGAIVSFVISYLLWILINKESINLKLFLIKNYKIVIVVLGVYIILSIVFKDIEIMWLSIWYFIYFFIKGVFLRNSKFTYIQYINLKKTMFLSIVLLFLTTFIFGFIYYDFIINKKINICKIMNIQDYNKYLEYSNFLNYRKNDYEREYHENLRLNLILYNRECKKYSKKEEEKINNNFVKFTKYQIEYNKKQGW